MKTYAQYLEFVENAESDINVYRNFIRDAIQSDTTRLYLLLDLFLILNVPTDYEGDVDRIWADGIAEIRKANNGTDLLKYAEMIWSLLPSVSEALFHSLEQFYPDAED